MRIITVPDTQEINTAPTDPGTDFETDMAPQEFTDLVRKMAADIATTAEAATVLLHAYKNGEFSR
jgi:hypothetical protein